MIDDRSFSAEELTYLLDLTQSGVGGADRLADRLEEWGRFAEAAKARDSLVEFQRAASPEAISSSILAQSAIAHALAGDAGLARERAAAAKANFDKRIADGDPEKEASEIVELLDLYAIIEGAQSGDLRTARRLFSARSRWVAASFGSVVEMTRRLRQGAPADDLIGGLAKSPDELWKDRDDARRAETIAKDSDNKTLFWLLPGTDFASTYRSVSGQTWRTEKSKLIVKPAKNDKSKLKMERLFLYSYSAGIDVMLDAYALHAALLAKSRGHKGFIVLPLISGGYASSAILTGNPGDPGMVAPLFNDAEETIATLRPLIPDPVTLKQLQAQTKK